jgi:hypothetical protein
MELQNINLNLVVLPNRDQVFRDPVGRVQYVYCDWSRFPKSAGFGGLQLQ